jgi:hypothetical protein
MQPTLITPVQSLTATPGPGVKNSPVIPFPANRPARVSGVGTARTSSADVPRPVRSTPLDKGTQDLSDMEIPTFIRRQMD